MVRDDEYLRTMLFEFEAESLPFLFYVSDLNGGDRGWKWIHHAELLCDQGFLAEHTVENISARRFRLTAKGHDFIIVTRDNTVWSKTKTFAAKGGAATVEVLFGVAVEIAKQKLIQETGIALS